MIKKILFFVLCVSVSTLFAQLPVVNKKEWKQLFNGKDLTGWDVKIRNYELNDNFGSTFRISNGNLKVSYDSYDKFDERFGHIFYKQKDEQLK